MTITFIGTGAADWDWGAMPPGTRGSTATLVGGSCLIDAGPTVMRGLAEAGVDPGAIADIVVTHSHQDHFRPETIAALSDARGGNLRVWAAPEAIQALGGIQCDKRPLCAGARFECGDLRYTALPSNHATGNIREQTFHFLIEDGQTTILYALDGAWILAKAQDILGRTLAGRKLDAVIWDATCGPSPAGWRYAAHNDLAMIDAMRADMEDASMTDAGTVHVLDHIARTLWPTDADERNATASRHGCILAEDGMSVNITMEA